jgi:hypothetical protein
MSQVNLLLMKHNLVTKFYGFDDGKDIEIFSDDLGTVAYLDAHQTNELINYLADQLRSIGEPIDLLNKIVE